ncbi:diguanylate cyclase domain-containing protein [Clostridioides sp. GD02377]|uniref:sensor domain-containing diguanylate cyclase n=1 Tax=unclassified Clostridioides TaxID=2635829 RepID=UPI0038ADB492
MKLKNALRLAFIVLTLIPIMIVSVLLYKSGFELSKKTYANNLNESINVQGDYISQTIESDIIYNSSFAKKTLNKYNENKNKEYLIEAFTSYLDITEDKIMASIMIDKDNKLIYSTGEKIIVDKIYNQVPNKIEDEKQKVLEFNLSQNSYSLGILTPVWINGEYIGSMISVYNESFIFKIISSYYDISDTATYICRKNGETINYKGYYHSEDNQIIKIEDDFSKNSFGQIESKIGEENTFGYYKSIHNTPWYLVILVEDSLIYNFTNQFIYIYIIIITFIFIADILLAFYFTNRVVKPIISLIKVMDEYQNNLDREILDNEKNAGYYETKYLRKKFFELMNTVSLAQHNFKGIYQLYQSNDMRDINIDIDVKEQKIYSNKENFTELLNRIELDENDCVIENFVKCFCKEDENKLRSIFENMRDKHLATSVEVEVYTSHLNQRWFHVVIVPLYEDSRLSRLFIQLRDISGFKKQEIESNKQARRDSLTGLYNRLGLMDYVHDGLENNRSKMYGILFADMNYFKLVNDRFGHSEGDRLLIQIGNDLLSIVKDYGIVSRLGGDEFIVLLPITSENDLTDIKSKIEEKLIYKYEYEEEQFIISASVGKATWDSDSTSTFEELLKQADESMYRVKRQLKGSIK